MSSVCLMPLQRCVCVCEDVFVCVCLCVCVLRERVREAHITYRGVPKKEGALASHTHTTHTHYVSHIRRCFGRRECT